MKVQKRQAFANVSSKTHDEKTNERSQIIPFVSCSFITVIIFVLFSAGRPACPPGKVLTVSSVLWQEVWIITGKKKKKKKHLILMLVPPVFHYPRLTALHLSSVTGPATARGYAGTISMKTRAWRGARRGNTPPRSSHSELVRSWRATTPRRGRCSCCSPSRYQKKCQ